MLLPAIRIRILLERRIAFQSGKPSSHTPRTLQDTMREGMHMQGTTIGVSETACTAADLQNVIRTWGMMTHERPRGTDTTMTVVAKSSSSSEKEVCLVMLGASEEAREAGMGVGRKLQRSNSGSRKEGTATSADTTAAAREKRRESIGMVTTLERIWRIRGGMARHGP